MKHFTDKGAYQGTHKIYLSNGRIQTFMFVDKTVWSGRLGRPIVGKCKFDSFNDFMAYATTLWNLAGIGVERWTSGNVSHTWGKDGVVSCELICAGSKTVHYGGDGMDDHGVRRWYVRLNKSIHDVDGAFDDNGWLSEEMWEILLHGLWAYGLQGTTELSSYSPTGRAHIGLRIYFKGSGKRIIVTNESFLDI